MHLEYGLTLQDAIDYPILAEGGKVWSFLFLRDPFDQVSYLPNYGHKLVDSFLNKTFLNESESGVGCSSFESLLLQVPPPPLYHR